ncbi:MAG: hypothetical protein MI749_00600, partial [Desulfovibrionales bacterium]|nr:hypothetical protein [Desulfovibrionales bacterium]
SPLYRQLIRIQLGKLPKNDVTAFIRKRFAAVGIVSNMGQGGGSSPALRIGHVRWPAFREPDRQEAARFLAIVRV